MQENYIRFLTNENIPYSPCAAFDLTRKALVHLYENISLDPASFQSQVSLYTSRKQSFSGHVVVVHKLQDEKVSFKDGVAAMEATIVTEYVPWRLNRQEKQITYEQGLFLIDGALRGVRQLLHRTKSPFLIEKYMIGVDAAGNVKVWWNEHFFRNKFSFNLSSDVRMKDMVISLVNIIASQMDHKDSQVFKFNLIDRRELTLMGLEKGIQEMSRGLNLKIIGINMLSENTEISFVNKRALDLVMSPQRQAELKTSNISTIKQSTIIVSDTPRKSQQDNQLITKRVYKDGLAPPQHLKMGIIKQDIERLRSAIDERQNPVLRHTRSLTNVISYDRGLRGDNSIPEVSRIMKYSMIQEPTQPAVSQFLEFKSGSQIITPTKQNPEHCDICTGVQNLRKSQVFSGRKDMNLSRIKSLDNLSTSRCLFSTERSSNEFKMKESFLQHRFGETEKKMPSSMYFASVLE